MIVSAAAPLCLSARVSVVAVTVPPLRLKVPVAGPEKVFPIPLNAVCCPKMIVVAFSVPKPIVKVPVDATPAEGLFRLLCPINSVLIIASSVPALTSTVALVVRRPLLFVPTVTAARSLSVPPVPRIFTVGAVSPARKSSSAVFFWFPTRIVVALIVFVCPRCTVPLFAELPPVMKVPTLKFAAVIVFVPAIVSTAVPVGAPVPALVCPPTLNVPAARL